MPEGRTERLSSGLTDRGFEAAGGAVYSAPTVVSLGKKIMDLIKRLNREQPHSHSLGLGGGQIGEKFN